MLTVETARLAWSAAQGLSADQPTESLSDTVSRTGWLRSIGGVPAYLALQARNAEATIDGVHAAVAARELRVSPSVRGCIYIVPAADHALSLRVAEHLSARRTERDREKLGITLDELDVLGEAVIAAASRGSLTTAKLRSALPDGAVRSLGDAGKKIGITSTLPLALRQLEFAGQLERRPNDDRLDHERYVWTTSNVEVGRFDASDAVALAFRYLAWAAPATRKEFAAWSGLSQKEAKAALAAPGIATDELAGEEVFRLEGQHAGDAGPARFLAALDNLYGLRSTAAHLVDPAHAEVEVSVFNNKGRGRLGEMSQATEHTIVKDGRVIGFWILDPSTGEIVRSLAPKLPASVIAECDAESERVHAMLSTIGHSKVHSLDNEKKQAARAERLRSLVWPSG